MHVLRLGEAQRAADEPLDPGPQIDVFALDFLCVLLTPTVSPLTIPPVYCHINSFQRASSVEKPWPGGEKRRDWRTAHPVEW